MRKLNLEVKTDEQENDYLALIKCIDIVDDWVKQTKQAGIALEEIQKEKYYLHWFDDFDTFCRKLWGIKASQAYNLIKFSRTAAILEHKGEIALLEKLEESSETVAKAIPKKATDEQVVEIVNRATNGGTKKPTYTSVNKAKQEVLGNDYFDGLLHSIIEDSYTESSYLYLIHDGEYTKIGIADDVVKRLKQLQTGNARKLRILHVTSHPKPSALERQLHKLYSEHRLEGEWFNLDADTLDELIGGLR